MCSETDGDDDSDDKYKNNITCFSIVPWAAAKKFMLV